MWGRHVEAELHQATRRAKSETQATQRAQAVIYKLMTDPEKEEVKGEEKAPPPPTGRFRDPAAMIRKA